MDIIKNYICKECGTTTTDDKEKIHGSFGKEIGLWILTVFGLFLWILPGLIIGFLAFRYSVRRWTQKGTVCKGCGARKSLIPANTPAGQAMLASFNVNQDQLI